MSPPSREDLSTDSDKDDRSTASDPWEDYWKSVEETYRRKWWQIWRPSHPPPPPLANMDEAPQIPLATASLFSIFTFSWITPVMVIGWQRPLQAGDLWTMDESRKAHVLAAKFDDRWRVRVKAANEWNAALENGTIAPGAVRRMWWKVKSFGDSNKQLEFRERWGKSSRREPSLFFALNDVVGWDFWVGGVCKIIGDTARSCAPLASKVLIKYAQQRADPHKPKPHIGKGIGSALGLVILTIMSSIFQHQWFWRSMTSGLHARTALINSLYTRSLNFTPKARTIHSNGTLVNHLSTDISRIDYFFQWFHPTWTSSIQATLLCAQMGPAALAGFAMLLLLVPVEAKAMKLQLRMRQSSMKFTDQRAGLLREILGAMRITKLFTYEIPLLNRISVIREQELAGVRTLQLMLAAALAIAFSIPALASVLAFIVYAAAGHSLDPAIIFTSLSLFGLLRQPFMFLPRSLSASTDGRNAFSRLSRVFLADTMEETTPIDLDLPFAVLVRDADFCWESRPGSVGASSKAKLTSTAARPSKEMDLSSPDPSTIQAGPFSVRGVNITIPRGGKIYAIVGSVGSGKSSLIQGLVGEMRMARGEMKLGGSLAYCAQTPWIQNASLVCSSEPAYVIQPRFVSVIAIKCAIRREFDEWRYWQVLSDASLKADLEILPDGDFTEIGERGINLSGGQKARVNLARALYSEADIVVLDDPLSAVDAHVGQSLFNDAILGLKARGKAVILVTHALHFLPQVDHVYHLANGVIHEEGTYEELISNGGLFSVLVRDFGSQNVRQSQVHEDDAEVQLDGNQAVNPAADGGNAKVGRALMQIETRKIGSISGAALMLLLFCATLMQVSQVLTNYWLIWWEDNAFHQRPGFYMVWILFMLLVALVPPLETTIRGASISWMCYLASAKMHSKGLTRALHAPMSFFDTTPLGRILGVFGKDMDIAQTLCMVLGSILLITILFHYFLPVAFIVVLGYIVLGKFYLASSREMKRLDGILRSELYSHFSESLSGLATIHAYGESSRFIADNARFIDHGNSALYLTITNQRWLSVRLDTVGSILIFSVSLMAMFGVNGVSPAQIGLVLTYVVEITMVLSAVTRQTAEVENNMNAVERIFQYTAYEINDPPPPPSWPERGEVEFKDVVLSYRPGLPPVLQGISFVVDGGQKIGVVGRTGAGKSSLMAALFRLVELSSGSIHIDGLDISKLGLRQLRSKISIIPQDPFIFSGTIRSNLDPFSQHDDARLWDALRRSHLVNSFDSEDEKSTPRFTLDTTIEPEGSNLSVGERSLLSLARALCKDSQIVVMDEATASVDLETDSKIQETVLAEFSSRTILCIAHRLRTIIHYDKILVLDQGQAIEFDTPLNLFDRKDGVFRSLCEQSHIGRKEIEVEVGSLEIV
ncbi:hypothetical protein BS47DRAFT_1371770 [Hydnum rufescens UP504]|uniref:ABC transporter n=1 Tax=Hydnum rufescens UP504 TaxID=1448309 RepID=A0A9P6B2I6_9AGAM|nr:hypothetical protein BS47DRAFT_1371770 [Hydnum rufescens UP504]